MNFPVVVWIVCLPPCKQWMRENLMLESPPPSFSMLEHSEDANDSVTLVLAYDVSTNSFLSITVLLAMKHLPHSVLTLTVNGPLCWQMSSPLMQFSFYFSDFNGTRCGVVVLLYHTGSKYYKPLCLQPSPSSSSSSHIVTQFMRNFVPGRDWTPFRSLSPNFLAFFNHSHPCNASSLGS